MPDQNNSSRNDAREAARKLSQQVRSTLEPPAEAFSGTVKPSIKEGFAYVKANKQRVIITLILVCVAWAVLAYLIS